MSGGVWKRLTACAAGALALVVLLAAPASAHSETVRSDPPNGGMVPEGRTSLTLWFDEPVGAAASTFQLRTLDGLELPSAVSFADGADEVVVTTDPLERGPYVLDWHALSLTDGHASSGTIVFGAGLRPDVVAAQGEGVPSVALVVLRWFDLGVLLLALGALTVSGRVLGAAGDGAGALRARVRDVGLLAGAATLYAGALTPFLRTRSPESSAADWAHQTWLTLTGTEWGRLWLVRELVLLVAVLAMLRWRRARGLARQAPRVAVASLAVAVLLQSWGGHAAALPTGSRIDALMGAGHVLASGVWVGGLVVLTLTLVPGLSSARSVRGARLQVLRAYSPRAAVASVVLLATGLYQAGHHVPDLTSLRSTAYGGAVAVKVLLVLLALALAAVNLLPVNPAIAARRWPAAGRRMARTAARTGPRTLARTITAETGVLVLAVLAAAVLTSVPTAREVAVATRPSSPDVASVDGLFMTFEAVPAGARQTRLILRMRSTIQPEPAPVESVEVRLDGPAGAVERATLTTVEEGRYEASTAPLTPGDWRGALSVHRPGLPDAQMTSQWEVASPAASLNSPLRGVSTVLSWTVLAALALALALVRRRRRPPGVARPVHTRPLERTLR